MRDQIERDHCNRLALALAGYQAELVALGQRRDDELHKAIGLRTAREGRQRREYLATRPAKRPSPTR